MKRVVLLLVIVFGWCQQRALATDTLQVSVDSVAVTVTADDIINIAKKYIGLPYRYGAMSPKYGFDCSGLVHYVFKQQNIILTRNSRSQYREGTDVPVRQELQKGDLVFFTGVHSKTTIGHVGIVIEANAETGEFLFIHAGRGGVRINSSSDGHYNRRYVGARRIL